MSKYTTYYKSRQLMYRDLAINWSIFALNRKLPDYQMQGMALFFKPIARRFGLTKDFRDIGVI